MPTSQATMRSRRALVLSGYAILLVGFAGLGVMPFLKQRADVRSKIDTLRREIDERNTGKHQLEDLQHQVQLASLLTRNYDRLVPSNMDTGTFIAQLSKELDRAGLRDVNLRTLSWDTLGKTLRQPIEVHARGTFAQVRDFLRAVEGLPRMSSVGRLSIDADSQANGTVEVQLTLYIYSTKPPQ